MARGGLSQESGAGAHNYQAGQDIHIHGPSIDQIRAVALDVFRSNAIELAGVAQTLAVQRAEQLTEEFLGRIHDEAPQSLGKLSDPDVQTALFEAQRGHSRSGEEDLRKALVDLLMERVDQDGRNLRALALNEAIVSVAKLTEAQRKSIAWVFYLKYTRAVNVSTLDNYYLRLEREAAALGLEFPTSHADYQHIEYVGAGSQGLSSGTLGARIMAGVEGLFTHGFVESDVEADLLSRLKSGGGVIPALRDPSRLQLSSLADEDMEEWVKGIGHDLPVEQLREISKIGRMSEGEVTEEVVERLPELSNLKDAWEDSKTGFSALNLTSVGIAIGHAYFTRVTDIDASLSSWLPG